MIHTAHRSHTAAPLAIIITATLLAGCGGHGRYTTEGISLARQRLNAMKAASEYDMARQSFLAGDLDKALRKSNIALSLAEENARLHVLQGRIHIERGAVGEALLSLRRAAEFDETSVEARYYLGVVHERLNEHDAALGHFLAAAELDPFNPQYPIAAGEMLIDLGRPDEARSMLIRSDAADHSAGIQQLLGHIAMIKGRPDEACGLFNKARLLAPDDGAILEDLATAQVAAGRYGDADRNLIYLLRDPANKNRRDLLHMRAECLLSLERPVEARELYRSLVADDGASDVQAWVGLGRTAFTLRDDRELRRAASRIVSIDPAEPDGYVLWAVWHRGRGEATEALEKLDTGLMRAGRDAELLSVRALVLADMGRNDEAFVAANSALELDPDNESCRRLVEKLGTFAAVPVD